MYKSFDIYVFPQFELIFTDNGKVYEKRNFIGMTQEGPTEMGFIKALPIKKDAVRLGDYNYAYTLQKGMEGFAFIEERITQIEARNANILLASKDLEIPGKGKIVDL